MNGVIEVKEFPMTNKVVVTFDETRLDRKALEGKIAEVGRKSGFVGIVLAR